MKMKRRIALILVAVLVMGALAGCGDKGTGGDAPEGDKPAKGDTKFLSVATGGPGGTYYPLGAAISTIINGSDLGLQATAQATGASVENVELIHNGDAEIAFIQNDIAYYAFNGIELFGEAEIEKEDGTIEKREQRLYPDIRGLCTLYPEVVQILASDKSGINSIEDLEGKKVAVGAPGSGTEVNARQVLDIHGLTYDDLAKADFLSFSEATDQIKNGQVDAAFVVAAIPTSSVTELATTHDIHLVPIAEDKANELIAKYPYYTLMDIQPGDYKGQEDPVAAVAVQAMLIVNESMEEDLVYNITKNIFEKLNVIEEAHARGKDITLDSALEGMSIELHSGAKKYFDEAGVK